MLGLKVFEVFFGRAVLSRTLGRRVQCGTHRWGWDRHKPRVPIRDSSSLRCQCREMLMVLCWTELSRFSEHCAGVPLLRKA